MLFYTANYFSAQQRSSEIKGKATRARADEGLLGGSRTSGIAATLRAKTACEPAPPPPPVQSHQRRVQTGTRIPLKGI